jgi:sulfur-oxidizing protein SoxA
VRLLIFVGLWLASSAIAAQDNNGTVTAPFEQPVSGYRFLTPETQALQDDAFANPGYLWVAAGAEAYQKEHGTDSCASCHGEGGMVGVATRYPRFDEGAQTLLNLEGRINACRTEHQKLTALAYESQELLALTSYVAEQSRGMMTQVSVSADAAPWFQAGEAYFLQRRGQLNLACQQCHDQSWGKMLRGDRLSQGQPNAFPAYRLEWQSLGSLHRRLQNCETGVRAEPQALGSRAYLGLELYLVWRSRGLVLEAPGVRR